MGGFGGGGGSRSAPPPPPDNSMAIMAMMMQAQQQMAAEAAARAEKAQREAAIRAEDVAAENRVAQGERGASQALSRLEDIQGLEDQAKADEAKQLAESTGLAATGGGYDVNAAREEAMKNLGMSSSALPQTPFNLAASTKTYNPAATTAGQEKRQNLFQLPDTTGLIFGGS